MLPVRCKARAVQLAILLAWIAVPLLPASAEDLPKPGLHYSLLGGVGATLHQEVQFGLNLYAGVGLSVLDIATIEEGQPQEYALRYGLNAYIEGGLDFVGLASNRLVYTLASGADALIGRIGLGAAGLMDFRGEPAQYYGFGIRTRLHVLIWGTNEMLNYSLLSVAASWIHLFGVVEDEDIVTLGFIGYSFGRF
jgi:hypothetical protein